MPSLKRRLTTNNILIGAGILFGTAGIITFAVSRSNARKKAELKERLEGVLFSPEDIAKAPVMPTEDKFTITQTEAKRRADVLYRAMKGGGTDEQTVYRAQLGVNAKGLMMIFNEFGVPSNENLWQWFVDDLGWKELLVVRYIWQKQGIIVPF